MKPVGVILDSGNVLIRPVGGEWFPGLSFGEVLARENVVWNAARLDEALRVAYAFLDDVHSIPLTDEAGERLVFTEYYRRILETVEAEGDRPALAAAIDDLHRERLPVELFEWTIPVLSALRDRDVPVVILSDAWPSLRRHYRELGLDEYVNAMVISAEEGLTKPAPAVFGKARTLLQAEKAFFVDDWAYNVRAANELGLRGLHLLHADRDPDHRVDAITDLSQLLEHL